MLVPDLEEIVQISCGTTHTAFLNRNGVVRTCGSNSHGQLGFDGNISSFKQPSMVPNFTLHDIVQISCGNLHTGFLTSTGLVFMSGSNSYGETGGPIHNDRDRIVRGIPRLMKLEGPISKIICNGYSTFLITPTGEVRAFGFNRHGQLGVGDQQNRTVPTLVPGLTKIRDVAANSSFAVFLQ